MMRLRISTYIIGGLAAAVLLLNCRARPDRQTNAETEEYKLEWQSYERRYLVHLPPEEKRQNPLPILFNIHGGGGTARGAIELTFGRFNELADRHGFLVVYPEAVEKNWNDGRKSDKVKAWKENIDDVGFIAAIVDELEKEFKIDRDRIFTTGMSNGGFMSSRLLCDRADLFRGAAILTATLSSDYLPKCSPAQPAAVLIMNGTADKLVPYNGGQVRVLGQNRGEIIPTDQLVDFWKEKNGCSEKRSIVNLPDKADDGTTVAVEEYGGCYDRGSLMLYTINGGGHTWPGGKQYLGEWLVGKTCRDINACDVIWDYFKSLK